MKFLVSIDLNKNELQNAVLQPLAVAPANPTLAQIYYNSADKLVYAYDGTAWQPVGAVTSVNGKTGVVTLGKSDVGLGNVDNTSDSTKKTNFTGSISSDDTGFTTGSAVYEALALKADASQYLPLSGGTMSGAIAMGSNKITGLANPTNDNDATSKEYVDTAIANLPEPMVFKGSLGEDGTITSLPTASSSNEGWTYKVITAGTYASQTAKIGDLFICANTSTTSTPTYAWTLIPSGDEPSGTVTSVTIKGTSPISVSSSSAITTSGTRTISHADSGVTAGTYPKVTVNATGHVTGGSTLASSDIPDISGTYLKRDGSVAMTGALAMGSNKVTGLAEPTSDGDAATKKYVDEAIAGGVHFATGTISTSATSTSVSYTGTLVNTYAKQENDIIICDISAASSAVTFSVAEAPSSAITCVVVSA